jgi:hypothetical protein
MGTTTAFSGESASGWQQVNFASPIAISANTNYVASVFSSAGYYSANTSYFTSAVTRGPLTAVASNGSVRNGVYRYNTTGFPNSTYSASNYWVDVVFSPAN